MEIRIVNLHDYQVGDRVVLLDALQLGEGRILRIEDAKEWARNITVVLDNDPTTHHYRSIADIDLVS